MLDMPRTRKQYVHREKTRHGKTVWYFRRGDGPRVRLPGEYESPEWLAAYEAALGGNKPEPAKSTATGTFKWLVERYQASAKFAGLAQETQKFRSGVLRRVVETAGDLRIASITRSMIAEGRDRRAATPFAAINYLKVMNQVFAFAVDAGYLPHNPAKGIDRPSPATDGHHTWTVSEVRRYQNRHPLGTRERLAMDLLLYTGLRRGDLVQLGRQHVRNGIIRYRATKNGVEIVLPMLPVLQATIDAGPTGDLTFLATMRNTPWKKESFGTWFRNACIAANVPGRAHGLRKAGATFAAENGASDQQLMAIFGWTNPEQAAVYTRTASRAKMAAMGVGMLDPKDENEA
ncbi:tyrosine-type recombinase/integrase [Devosia algicola]|uniref:Tyrosine-type recombinase/integrase n=1 Tax=Devosia algicola TaxID=3026418 RepID=A0ABY7YQR2_9HYPH|nr:tyrosine-type recombinase/integrase [Devosia algicola]WDR03666.1 tyrosine-type recombinase/integrase [Devosia algicola]